MRRALLLLALAAAPLGAQSPIASADSAISAGQPWRATQLIAPLLASPATRTPEAVLLAARAAAAWEGWPTVSRLLEHEVWIDTAYDRLGRRLLAEADLGESRNPQAVVDALAAVAGDGNRARDEQGRRLILLARAYDRLDQLDSAAAVYRRAQAFLPDLGDWLILRTAGVTRDSAARVALYAGVALPAALPRVPWTEALARDRSDDFDGAASRYDRLGAHVAAFKVRWRGAASDSAKRDIAAGLARLMLPATSVADARDALDLIRTIDPPFTRDERLAVARRAANVTRPQDAVDQFARAAKDGPLPAHDRVAYGTALGAVQRWADAAEQFASITDPAIAGQAAYFHARALLRNGQNDAAATALRAVVRKYPSDSNTAAIALYLLADLAVDAGQVDSARSNLLRVATRYPGSPQRARAILNAALIAFERGRPQVTVQELTRALDAKTVTGEVDASRYWIARARLATGDSAAAMNGFRELVARGPDNYYAVRAAARLDTIPWPALNPVTETPPDSLDGIFDRAHRLDMMGMDMEAKFERDRIAAEAKGADAERVGEAFLARGFISRATQLGQRASTAGAARDATLWQLLYPLPFAGSLREAAAQEHVDPLLVASVIRQESGFDPHATSRTNARGLMQVEPSVGRDLAQIMGFPDFDPAELWQPAVNLPLGIRHFATGLTRYPELERGVAAYNAGTSRVDHWTATPLSGQLRDTTRVRDPIDDVEIFVERIPFVETRDYVRAIVRNQAVYRMIYGAQK
jgi:soluble lytic murein transglycosylase